jgi:phospholipid/cholesterol/gamma-HCH transport system substrate-binding protein
MTQGITRNRGLLIAVVTALVVALAAGIFLLWPGRGTHKIVGLFTNAVGLYPGDDVRVVGVPVGKIDSIEPRAGDVKITMSVNDDVKVPADARAIIVSPNLVAARFIQLTPPSMRGRATPRWPMAPRSGWTAPVSRSSGTRSKTS